MWVRALALAGVASACNSDRSETTERPAAAPVASPRVDEALAKIIATCAEVVGTVEVRRKGQPQWDPASVGATLRERDWVRTAAGAFARIRFSGRGFLDLPEQTTILVDSAISIETGSLVAVAAPGEPLVVRAADGTEARIVAADGEAPAELRLMPSKVAGLEVAVTKGTVKVITRAGEQPVAAGEASDVANERTGEVVKLLDFPRSVAPGIDARFLFAPDKPIAMTWKPVAGATRYQIQVARDTELRSLVLGTETTATTAAFTPTSVGEYAWRVAAIDAQGRLGEYGFVRRMYIEEESPRELLLAPTDGARIGFADKMPRVTFSWRPAGDTKRYKLVIGRGPDPKSQTVVTLETANQQLIVTALREGTYRWGVYAIRDRETPIFLAPRELTIRKQHVKAHTDKLWETGTR